MASNRFYTFVGQHETGRYAKAHKHHSTAVLICIEGKGYTYTWPDALGTAPWRDGKADKILRQDYEPVGLVSAAPMSGDWYQRWPSTAPRLAWSEQSSGPQAGKARREDGRYLGHRSQ
jgi:hypothetical protein